MFDEYFATHENHVAAVNRHEVATRDPGRIARHPGARNDRTADDSHLRSQRSLMKTVYDELRRIARARIRQLGPDQSLQPTELVHEVYLRLAKAPEVRAQNRNHFRAIAAQAMYYVLHDHFRHKQAEKHGGKHQQVHVEVTLPDAKGSLRKEDFVWLHRRLADLHRESPEHAEVVILRYFGGFTMNEIATVQHVHKTTVERRWRFARAWLQDR